MRRLRVLLSALLLALAGPALAVDFVTVDGRLDDQSFYRLVSCGAAPGGPCREQPVRWAKRQLTVSFAGREAGYPQALANRTALALRRAVAEINAARSGVTLTLAPPGSPSDIRIWLRDLPDNAIVTGTGIAGLDGQRLGIARFHIRWDSARRIQRGIILISRDIWPESLDSVMLEELVQALGLRWDVRSATYRGRSIFDEDGNAVRQLRGQDRTALRLHYPVGN